jgi:acetyltransferase
MAFIVTAPLEDGGEETLGVVRAFVDPDNVQAEFGILIRSDAKAAGLGRRLMNKLITFLRSRGTQRLIATVLAENAAMRSLASQLGFHEAEQPSDVTTRRIEMPLR